MKPTLLPVLLAALLTLVACSKQQPTPSTGALNVGLPAKLCNVLKKVTPEVRQMPPVGAQARLVMEIAAAFDTNAAMLERVSDEIDTIASESCPAERDLLLSVLKKKSLQEAIR